MGENWQSESFSVESGVYILHENLSRNKKFAVRTFSVASHSALSPAPPPLTRPNETHTRDQLSNNGLPIFYFQFSPATVTSTSYTNRMMPSIIILVSYDFMWFYLPFKCRVLRVKCQPANTTRVQHCRRRHRQIHFNFNYIQFIHVSAWCKCSKNGHEKRCLK